MMNFPHQALRRIRHVALDMDGTIYAGQTLFPWTLPFLRRLGELDIGHTFLTNNPSKSTRDYLAQLAKFGVTASTDQLYTSAHATIEYLRRHHPDARRLFLLGTPSMVAEFESAGFTSTSEDASDEPDAVIVGFDLTLTFARLGRAAWWIRNGKPYLATNPDRVCPTDQPTVLVDCGSLCAALKEATGRAPDVVLGKPDPTMIQGILARHGLRCDEVAMVGDRIYTDVRMAQNAGVMSVLVLSGECTEADVAHAERRPDLIVPTLGEFGQQLAAARVVPVR
ncbi:MAG: hydrolase [Opitutus sp.]|nr:hydrolase [Opitutus sp.]